MKNNLALKYQTLYFMKESLTNEIKKIDNEIKFTIKEYNYHNNDNNKVPNIPVYLIKRLLSLQTDIFQHYISYSI